MSANPTDAFSRDFADAEAWRMKAATLEERIRFHNESFEALMALNHLVAAGRRAEVAFNTVRGCYERNPGNFAVAMRELDREVADFSAALAAFENTP